MSRQAGVSSSARRHGELRCTRGSPETVISNGGKNKSGRLGGSAAGKHGEAGLFRHSAFDEMGFVMA